MYRCTYVQRAMMKVQTRKMEPKLKRTIYETLMWSGVHSLDLPESHLFDQRASVCVYGGSMNRNGCVEFTHCNDLFACLQISKHAPEEIRRKF